MYYKQSKRKWWYFGNGYYWHISASYQDGQDNLYDYQVIKVYDPMEDVLETVTNQQDYYNTSLDQQQCACYRIKKEGLLQQLQVIFSIAATTNKNCAIFPVGIKILNVYGPKG